MKRTFGIVLAVLSLPALAWVTPQEIAQAERACQLESSSMLKDRNGTPSCGRVKELYRQQRLETRAQMQHEYNQSQERIAATPQQVIITNQVSVPTEQGGGYHWNATYGKYCYHNPAGYATSCN